MARVRISKTPKALSGLEVKMRPGLYGTNGNRQFTLPNQVNSQRFSQQPVDVRDTLQPVAREGANLEAEKDETALVNINGIPAHFKIGGKRHHSGGTPLNLPDNSFIFSDTAKMKIKDPIVLAQFGMVPKKSGYTPAEIAKKYDINTFRKILADPNSEDIERKTAEAMISNYNMKLAKLALVQESTKGFPQGIPAVAMPYVIANEINPEELFETQGQEEQPDADMGVSRYGGNMISQFNTKQYGGIPKAQTGVSLTKKIADKVAAEKLAIQKQRQEDYLNETAYLQESANDQAIQSLRKLYEGIKGSQESLPASRFLDFLPGVTSLEEQSKMFSNKGWNSGMAEIYQYDPELLQQKFEDEPNQPRYHVDPKTGFIKTVYKKKTTAQDPIVKEINKKVKDWKKPTPSEIKSLTGYEAEYLNNLLVKHKGTPIIKETVSNAETSLKSKLKDWTNPTEAELDALSEEEATYLENLYKKNHLLGYEYGGSFEDGGSLQDNETFEDIETFDEGGAKGRLKSKIKGSGTATTKSGTKPGTKKPNTEYDVYSPETLKAAEEKGYTISKIDPSVQYTGTSVGAQSLWDPESGFYYKEGAPKPGKAGLDYYMKLHEDAIAEYVSDKDGSKGADAWKRDHLEAANKKDKNGRFGRGDKAIEHVITKTDDNYFNATGKRLLDRSKPDWNVPGVQLFNLPGIYKKKEEAVVPPADDKKKEEEKPIEEKQREAFERNTPVPYTESKNAPWWLQDIIKTAGAAGDLARIKKYQPWQATPQVRLPDATFYDPTRELAANAEQANMAYQAQTAFTNPQQLAAASAMTQGQAAKNAADVMGRYNNLNVGLANQLSKERTDIMNTASQNKANLDTQLWDKYSIVNQQFDNSRNQARQNLRQSYIDAITNRANTANMNSLYPQYAIDPSRGGFAYFKGDPSKLKATNKQEFEDSYAKALKVTGDPDRALKYLQLQATGNLPKENDQTYPNVYPGTSGS